jgi:hypothetical protein
MLTGHPLEPDHPSLADRARDNLIPETLYSALARALDPVPQRRFSSVDAFGVALGQAAWQVLSPAWHGRRAVARTLTPDQLRQQGK